MARNKTKSSPVLPGLSRSTACGSKSCARLKGHKGDHRTSLHATAKPSLAGTATKSPVRLDIIAELEATQRKLEELKALMFQPTKSARKPVDTEGGVEVLSFDRYTVQEPKATRRVKPKAQPVKAQRRGQLCRVSRDGVRCQRPFGHKQAGIRHSFAGAVRVLPTVGPKGRDVQTVKGKTSRRRGFTTSAKPSSRLA